MPTNTYTPLGTITLSASASEVIFSGIPASLNGQSFRDLVLVVNGGVSQNSYCGIQFNGDTASNYTFVDATFEGSVASNSGSNTWIPQRFTATSNSFAIYQIMDYTATDKHKTVLVRNNRATDFVYMAAGRWANTSAITSITVDVEGTRTWNSGTTMSLYAIAG